MHYDHNSVVYKGCQHHTQSPVYVVEQVDDLYRRARSADVGKAIDIAKADGNAGEVLRLYLSAVLKLVSDTRW